MILIDASHLVDKSTPPPPPTQETDSYELTEDYFQKASHTLRTVITEAVTEDLNDPLPDGPLVLPPGALWKDPVLHFQGQAFDNSANKTFQFYTSRTSAVFDILKWNQFSRLIFTHASRFRDERTPTKRSFLDISRLLEKKRFPDPNFTTDNEAKLIIQTQPTGLIQKLKEDTNDFNPNRPYVPKPPLFSLEDKTLPFLKALQTKRWETNDSSPDPKLKAFNIPPLSQTQIKMDHQLRSIIMNNILAHAQVNNQKNLILSLQNLSIFKLVTERSEIITETDLLTRFSDVTNLPLAESISTAMSMLLQQRRDLREALTSRVRNSTIKDILKGGNLLSELPFDPAQVKEAIAYLNSSQFLTQSFTSALLQNKSSFQRPQPNFRQTPQNKSFTQPQQRTDSSRPSTSSGQPSQPFRYDKGSGNRFPTSKNFSSKLPPLPAPPKKQAGQRPHSSHQKKK